MRTVLTLLVASSIALGTLVATSACGRETGSSSRSASPKAVNLLNSLARGELSAVETYRQAIAKEGSASAPLTALLRHHEEAGSLLAARVRALGGTPPTDSGVWGDLVKALEGTAKVFGNDTAMRALRAGEAQGTQAYESALADADLDSGSKELIRTTLLPRQREHAASVQRLIDAPANAGGSAATR